MSDHPPHSDLPQSPPPASTAAIANNEGSKDIDPLKKYETVVSSGQAALRALFTLNGGATIAFLTFLGHLWDKPPTVAGGLPLVGGGAFVTALRLFIYGSFGAVLGYGTIFLTNCVSTIESKRPRWKRVGRWLFGITVVVGFASILCFLGGSCYAVKGFESMQPK